MKIRGTAAHIAEKYTALARDAQVMGDSVAGESYHQYAEHYNRIVMANQAQQQAAAAAQGERINGSGRDRQNAPAENDGQTQPEAAPAAVPGGSSAVEAGTSDANEGNSADTRTSDEKAAPTGNAPSGETSSGKSGDDEGLARMMARSSASSGNGADTDKEKPAKAAKASKAPKAAKKDSSAGDAETDEAPDEAVT